MRRSRISPFSPPLVLGLLMAICVLSDGRGGVEGHAREQNEGWSEEGNREDQRKDQHDSQNEGQSEGKEGHDRGGRGDGSSTDTGSASPTATKTIAVGPGVLVLRLPTCVPQHVTRPTSPSTPRRAGGLRGGAEGGREGGGEEGWSAHSNRPMPCVVRVGVSGGSLLRYRETVFGAVETAGGPGGAGGQEHSGPQERRQPQHPLWFHAALPIRRAMLLDIRVTSVNADDFTAVEVRRRGGGGGGKRETTSERHTQRGTTRETHRKRPTARDRVVCISLLEVCMINGNMCVYIGQCTRV